MAPRLDPTRAYYRCTNGGEAGILDIPLAVLAQAGLKVNDRVKVRGGALNGFLVVRADPGGSLVRLAHKGALRAHISIPWRNMGLWGSGSPSMIPHSAGMTEEWGGSILLNMTEWVAAQDGRIAARSRDE